MVEIKVVLNAESQKRRSTHVWKKKAEGEFWFEKENASLLSQHHYHLNKQSKCHDEKQNNACLTNQQ